MATAQPLADRIQELDRRVVHTENKIKELDAREARGAQKLTESQTRWAAATAIGTVSAAFAAVVTLYFLFRQVGHAVRLGAYRLLRDEGERYDSRYMREGRARLARALLNVPEEFNGMADEADDVLSFFEDLGLMFRKKLVPRDMVWAMYADEILGFWAALAPYVKWYRQEEKDPHYWEDFEYLNNRILDYQRKHTPGFTSMSPERLRTFLEDEAAAKRRRWLEWRRK